MAPPLKVHAIIAEPPRSSWWKRHRHLVLAVLGLFLGWQLHTDGGAIARTPAPASTHQAAPSVSPLPHPSGSK